MEKHKQYKYTLNGVPNSYSKTLHSSDMCWGSTKEIELIHKISLTSQHDDRALLTCLLALKIDFYFADSHSKSSRLRIKDPGGFRIRTPLILDLCKFHLLIGTGIIWSDHRIIIKVDAEKHLSDENKTIFTVVPYKG